MSPLAIGIIFALGLGVASSRRSKPAVGGGNAMKNKILWEDDGSYVIGEGWWSNVGTPRLQEIVQVMEQSGGGQMVLDPYAIAYSILEGQTGPFQRPSSAYPVPPPQGQAGEWGDTWQTDVPGRPDFYDGPSTVLYLTDHVAQHVAAALDGYSKGYPLVMTGALDVCPDGYSFDEGTQQCIPTTPSGSMPGVECPPGYVYNVRQDMCVPSEGQ